TSSTTPGMTSGGASASTSSSVVVRQPSTPTASAVATILRIPSLHSTVHGRTRGPRAPRQMREGQDPHGRTGEPAGHTFPGDEGAANTRGSGVAVGGRVARGDRAPGGDRPVARKPAISGVPGPNSLSI